MLCNTTPALSLPKSFMSWLLLTKLNLLWSKCTNWCLCIKDIQVPVGNLNSKYWKFWTGLQLLNKLHVKSKSVFFGFIVLCKFFFWWMLGLVTFSHRAAPENLHKTSKRILRNGWNPAKPRCAAYSLRRGSPVPLVTLGLHPENSCEIEVLHTDGSSEGAERMSQLSWLTRPRWREGKWMVNESEV